HVPGALERQIVLNVRWTDRVVEDDQPIAELSEHAPAAVAHFIEAHLRPELQPDRAGEPRKGQAQCRRILSGKPPDEGVVFGETIRVLQRDLRLAHAAQAEEHLVLSLRWIGNEALAELGEVRFAP